MANGGIIGPVVTPPNVQTQSAPGVWTLQEAQEYIRQGLWPRRYDPLYNYTTLLLSGNGANNATNNSFLDSSSNNFTITRNGNTTQGTFSPFSQTGWGNYFDGTGDYLSVADNSVLRLGTSNFTIECWVNRAANGTAHSILAKGGASTGWLLEVTSGNVLQFTHTTTTITTSLPVYAGNWVHVAAVREGTGANQFKLYINGTLAQTATMSTDFTQTDTLYIGANRSAATTMNGYISNVRIVNGTALYTAQFTPSTTPLTTTSQGATASQVELLTCQSNRFLDNSGNGFTVTPAGNSAVVAFSPFNATQPWDPLTYGGSGYFDGSGDYLTVADNSALEVPTQDFTIEAWVYLTSLPSSGATYTVIQKGRTGTSDFEYSFEIENNAGNMRLICRTSSNGTSLTTANGNTISLTANTWYHVAVTRTTTTASFWFGGVAAGSGTVNSTTYTGAATVGLFANNAGSSPLVGYASNFRLVKGVAVYTGTFTPPTSPLAATQSAGTNISAITGTQTSLLLNFTNIGITDATSKNTLETVGDAKISTAQSKFGGSSMVFDGTGDYLAFRDSDLFAFGSSDLTIECWVYATTSGLSQGIAGQTNSSVTASATSFVLYLSSTSKISAEFYVGSTLYIVTSSNNLVYNQWNHIAVVRDGGTIRLYINGQQDGTVAISGSVNDSANQLAVGRLGEYTSWYWNGYIQDFRITKGVNRYKENFAVPDSAFATLGNTPPSIDPYFDYTTLLLPGSGSNNATNNSFLDSSANNFTITRNGNTTQGTFSPFSQTGWGNYFDGTGDYLSVPDNAAFTMGSGDFTIEFWAYTTTTNNQTVIIQIDSGGSTSALSFGVQINTSKWRGILASGTTFYTCTASANAIANQWNHIAFVRNGNTGTLYINGTADGTVSLTGVTINDSSQVVAIGGEISGSNMITGYISNARIVKGTAVYTSNFTPSTTPLTAVSGTSLLTCQSNRFIDNSSNNFTITVNGNTSVVAFSPFNPSASWSAATNGGSGYFDGSGDYLTAGSASDWTFLHNGSSWTVEFDVFHSLTTSTGIVTTNITTGSTGFGVLLNDSAANKVDVIFTRGVAGSQAIFSSNAALVINSWNHVAITFDTSTKTCSFYINGVAQGSSSNTGFAYSSSTPTYTLAIGRYQAATPGGNLTGYLSNVRISNTVRTGLTTLPTSPYTSDANTSLLLNFTNAGIYDATSKNDLETVGDAKISTAQSVWTAYGSSMYFDGTGDYLVGRTTDLLSFNTGDFTVEMWIYPNSVAGAIVLLDTRASASDSGWAFYINSSSTLALFSSNADRITAASALSASTWTHIVLARSGSTLAVYMNGVQSATATYSTTMTCPGRISIASGFDNAAPLNGYIQDLRITKGYARYKSAFQPPSAPLALR